MDNFPVFFLTGNNPVAMFNCTLTACTIFPDKILESALFASSNWSSQLCFSLIVPVYITAKSKKKKEENKIQITWGDIDRKIVKIYCDFYALLVPAMPSLRIFLSFINPNNWKWSKNSDSIPNNKVFLVL